ncbi:hypothetical protein GCM10025866_15680 [Naasia aerilata]|uniref:SIS domain-containing protein n=2 Tax=Naasia aerilata TaxID=1162966 RepID=A0ABM8GBP7_9MICO|nr:hypothetical protein GCM10025866_15680 [Naasia aerilata]
MVLLVGVQRRPAGFARLVQAVAESPATGVMLADPSARAHAARLDWTLEFPLASPSAFDSYAAAASLVSLLAGAVLTALGQEGAERVRGVRSRYAALGELEGP